MSDEHIIKHSPFEPAPRTGDNNNNGDHKNEQPDPLVIRSGFGQAPKPETQVKPEVPAKPEAPKPEQHKPADSTPKPEHHDNPGSKQQVDTKPVYDIQNTYSQVQNLQRQMLATCYDRQPDGSYKPKTGKISDGKGGMVEVEAVQSFFVAQMCEKYETAVNTADKAMKDPDSVIGATMSAKTRLESATQQTKSIQSELEKQGINVAVGGYLDTTLVNRDLRIMQETPVVTRQSYSEFLRSVGLPNTADKWMNDAKKISDDLNSPVGRSEFMKRQMEQTKQDKDSSLDKAIQDKYLKPVQDLEALVSSAKDKTTKGDLAGARADMEQARAMAGKMPAVDAKDEQAVKTQADQLQKDRDTLNQKLKDGTATPNDVRMQQEKELKLINEAKILDAVKLAKPRMDVNFADFLLNADKDKFSESNRKYARDLLMNVAADKDGKIVASQSAEQFDKLMDRALNGSLDNQASMRAFNKAMQDYDALKAKAATESDDKAIAADFQAARSKAAEAAQIASRINRDAAQDNEQKVKQNLQKAISDEMAKPAAERDEGKIKLMQAVMKPTHELNAEEKKLMAGLMECMKPEDKADKAQVEKITGMLKDKSAIFDVLSSYSTIQQMEFQKQALNQARIAMLDIDIAFDKGENNPLVREIEGDKYGGEMIAALNSIPGHDGRTQWGDIKEATRELGWGEKLWQWTKGTLKEVAIGLVSWGVGALAGVGAAALFSWSGPGAVIGGGAVGFAAGAATGSLMRKYVFGDKVTLTSAALDGISGMTGGVMGTTYAVARGVGTAAVENVIATQAERGVTIGANQTWQAFKAAGMADKMRIAVGGSPFLASFTSATAGSIASRYPTEALTGNYQTVGDWAVGSTIKVAGDIPTNLVSSYIGGRIGGPVEQRTLAAGGSFYQSATRQLTKNFLWSSPESRYMFSSRPVPHRSPFNAPVYDFMDGKPQDK